MMKERKTTQQKKKQTFKKLHYSHLSKNQTFNLAIMKQSSIALSLLAYWNRKHPEIKVLPTGRNWATTKRNIIQLNMDS